MLMLIGEQKLPWSWLVWFRERDSMNLLFAKEFLLYLEFMFDVILCSL